MQAGARGLGGSFVLVDQAAEDLFAAYSPLLGEIDDLRRRARWRKVDAAMRSVLVVVAQILGQDVAQVALTEDEHPVGQFGAQSADPALGIGVRPWTTWWGLDDLDASGSEGSGRSCR